MSLSVLLEFNHQDRDTGSLDQATSQSSTLPADFHWRFSTRLWATACGKSCFARHDIHETQHMSTITTKDGTSIYYKDWGKGPVVTLSHGWPLNSDMWDGQMLFLAQHGFRVVAHDRRGHGRSSQAWSGNDMDGYADDLAALIEALDLNDITLVGHSTGGGEVTRYIGRYSTKRRATACDGA
jgi:alpha-beta hydrolase superfamily lysophospholipase